MIVLSAAELHIEAIIDDARQLCVLIKRGLVDHLHFIAFLFRAHASHGNILENRAEVGHCDFVQKFRVGDRVEVLNQHDVFVVVASVVYHNLLLALLLARRRNVVSTYIASSSSR